MELAWPPGGRECEQAPTPTAAMAMAAVAARTEARGAQVGGVGTGGPYLAPGLLADASEEAGAGTADASSITRGWEGRT